MVSVKSAVSVLLAPSVAVTVMAALVGAPQLPPSRPPVESERPGGSVPAVTW